MDEQEKIKQMIDSERYVKELHINLSKCIDVMVNEGFCKDLIIAAIAACYFHTMASILSEEDFRYAIEHSFNETIKTRYGK